VELEACRNADLPLLCQSKQGEEEGGITLVIPPVIPRQLQSSADPVRERL